MRLIDADALKNALENNPSDFYDYDELIPMLDEQPTVSPDDVRGVGKWIDKSTGQRRPGQMQSWCSACGQHSGIGGIESNRHKAFCPNCGARMEVTSDA